MAFKDLESLTRQKIAEKTQKTHDIGHTVATTTSNVATLIESVGAKSASEIYKTITQDFTFPSVDINKERPHDYSKGTSFRRSECGKYFLNRFDMPTFLSFKVEFVFDDKYKENILSDDTLYADIVWNNFPHPFLYVADASTDESVGDFYTDKLSGNLVTEKDYLALYKGADASKAEQLSNRFDKPVFGYYSAYNYLKNALGETKRAELLLHFIDGLKDIQTMYPYYFKSISGIGGIGKIQPQKGVRLDPNANTITIDCDEAIDMRMNSLMESYTNIVWDNVYQRWILPDMMRRFRMNIYISEIRMFHRPQAGATRDGFRLVHDIMNEMMPTIKLECSQCEFDITDRFAAFDTLTSAKPNKLEGPKLKVKIGNVKETHMYPLNIKMYDAIIQNKLNADDKKNMESFVISDKDLMRNSTKMGPFNLQEEALISQSTMRTLYSWSQRNNDMTGWFYIPLYGGLSSYFKSTVDLLTQYVGEKVNDGIHALVGGGKQPMAQLPKNPKYSGMEMLKASMTSEGVLQKISLDIENYIKSVTGGTMSTATSRTIINGAVGSILGGILDNLKQSTATEGTERFQEMIWDILNDSKSAADPTRTIAEMFDKKLQEIHSEAIEDLDHGYVDQRIEQPPYMSTATERGEIENTMPEYEIHSEATEDADNGYQIQGLISTPYVSTATTDREIQHNMPKYEIHSEAIEDADHGYVDQRIEQPPYVSTATERNSIENTMPKYEIHSEAIEDTDHGYTKPEIEQPPYKSTATESVDHIKQEIPQPNYVSTAVDNVSIKEEMVQPEYRSTATESGKIAPQIVQPEYHSTATEQKEIKADMVQPKYHSTATETGEIAPQIVQPEYHSTATENKDIAPQIVQPEYHSTATENKEIGQQIVQPEYHSTATENDEIAPQIVQPEYHSTATENKNIDKQIVQPEYHSTATEHESIEEQIVQPKYRSTATENRELETELFPNAGSSSVATERNKIDGGVDEKNTINKKPQKKVIKSGLTNNTLQESATSRSKIDWEPPVKKIE